MYFFHKKTSESLSIYGYIEDNVIYIESICMYFVEMVRHLDWVIKLYKNDFKRLSFLLVWNSSEVEDSSEVDECVC